jgi:hypothetical protein
MTSSSPATDSPSLIESFEPLEDPRHGEIYPLEEIVVLVICATISGADTFVAAQQFGEARQEWLRGLLPFEKGIPSHDVLIGVFGRIDPVQFEDCFRSWVHGIRRKTDGEVVAIDGKTLCGSGDVWKRRPGHRKRASASGRGVGSRGVGTRAETGFGPTPIRERIKRDRGHLSAFGGASAGRMHCHDRCDGGPDRHCGGDPGGRGKERTRSNYVLRVKDNQKSLRADIERVFERCREQGVRPGTTDVDGGHGRVETRRCRTMEVGGRGLIDSARWAGARSIALIETERFEADPSAESGAEAGSAGGDTTTERRYVLSSLPPDAPSCWRRPVGTGGSKTDCIGA